MATIRVVHLGLGPIGAAIARQIATRPGLRIVGAVDVDPAKVGRDVGEVAGDTWRLGVRVEADLESTLARLSPDIVVHCTSSSLRVVAPQIHAVLRAGVAVVSTTEELSYPVGRNRRLARAIDALAKKANVAVLGTGVNPGFAMDALPIAMTAVCERVDRVTVNRIQDARIRRLPFQQKIGSGLTRAEFNRRVEAGTVRHVGLTESVTMIADAMGWKLDSIADTIRPKIARTPVESAFLRVDAGRVCGIVQDGIGYRDGDAIVRLHMEAYLGAPATYDAIAIDGSPKLSVKVDGGIHGDIATASIAVNSIPQVLAAPPGLRTMRDMVLPSFFPGARR
ncbi:MAG: dihydrodipicolinate reductase [Vicinamibacterales bacterium]